MVTAAAPAPRSNRPVQYQSEFFATLVALIATIVVVHGLYVAYVQPVGDQIVATEQARLKADPNYVPKRSLLLVINAPEQEVEIIHFIWAILILGFKAVLVRRERQLLERELIRVPEGIKVLPEDRSEERRVG